MLYNLYIAFVITVYKKTLQTSSVWLEGVMQHASVYLL
jgi:hypothetical protein